MSGEIELSWQVEDGYAGGARPQTTYFDAAEFEGCESREEVQNLLEELMHEELMNKVSWTASNYEVVIESVMASLGIEP